MIDKLIFGRYVPGESLIHKLDARTKLLAGIYFIGILFLANNLVSNVLLVLFTLFTMMLTGIKLTAFMKGIRPLIWLILFTVMMQVLFTIGGTVYFTWGPVAVSSFGLIKGTYIFIRFILIIMMSTLVMLTTTPMDLMRAIEYWLYPFKYINVPVQDVALMVSVALRFVPTLVEETEKIMKAQQARGVEFGVGNLFQQMKSVVPIFIPLFVSSFNRAEDLANAMEARGYQGGNQRTKFHILHWHLLDGATLMLFLLITMVLVMLRTT
ncbi:energy-coupling factor transporter transmembrane protein EcfT [Listeria sp. PSOL-1]|uniref:energy-coupling factor transporter transmembrane component T family protein n=1 Tax=Listeria sp. PSOL-1 TaxID=1844999 RepID=UPI0013D58CB9|nr:energy-coupling factor transporter transmembrane component T [Listeria sp. PSOL-1]